MKARGADSEPGRLLSRSAHRLGTGIGLFGAESDAGEGFRLTAGGAELTGLSPLLQLLGTETRQEDGRWRESARLAGAGLDIVCHTVFYEDEAVAERWLDIRNAGDQPLRIERIEPLRLRLEDGEYIVHAFDSDWGAEFEPRSEKLDVEFIAQTRWGRSSKGMHPWLTLERSDGRLVHLSPIWSGNWSASCRRTPSGIDAGAGLNEWAFFKTLQPGESMRTPSVAVVAGEGGDWHALSLPLARVGRRHWYPDNAVSRELPAEWNHWWSYEDTQIDAATFKANAAAAAELGFGVCTLDAGWFGSEDAEGGWHEQRGDWDKVNRMRFPGGVRECADEARRLGMRFGLWCEIEGLGRHAELAGRRPDFPARREGEPLGYVCLGNPQAREWAFAELDRLIRESGCEWVKLDFNVDPLGGCDRTDHGHGEGDGLFEHVRGLYEVLERLRAVHSEVLLENCSSGGLRLDLGMARVTHLSFLSDPDWPEHSLQVFWGASTFLAPERALHWSYSHWLGDFAKQRFDPQDPTLSEVRFDYYTRIGMLGAFGVSQKLPELPRRLAERLAVHVRDYREQVSRFVREADLYRLTAQPLRDGRGSRWAAFQYALGEEHLLAVFRLEGGEASRVVRLRGLRPDGAYELRELGGTSEPLLRSGASLLQDGLAFDGWAEEQSALYRLRLLPPEQSEASG